MPPSHEKISRIDLLPEAQLPDVSDLLDEARQVGSIVGDCLFLDHYGVPSEYHYKRNAANAGHIMLHGQIGYRSLEQSCRAYAEIHQRLEEHGYTVDRYGICLDWSMGYPSRQRAGRPRGTGLILQHPDDYRELTAQAPVAPHFGDFVMGMPAAFETTICALKAGSTSIGNLGQYFTFRLPNVDDDVVTTTETIKAIALCGLQPQPILVHSNLDDGFAALFTDMCCALGAVLIEQTIVEDLLGGRCSHCFGHTYSDPLTRLAFGMALAEVSNNPGSMIYGNTTSYTDELTGNFASLANYLNVDISLQRIQPSGHAINPVPVTEALRIPSIQEVVEAHLFANRLIKTNALLQPLLDYSDARNLAKEIVAGGKVFHANVLNGLSGMGVDIGNPLELLLSIRRLGARQLELRFGPGNLDHRGKRIAKVESTTLREIQRRANDIVDALDVNTKNRLQDSELRICTVTTDVHEYGKVLLEHVLTNLHLNVIDGGVCTDPDRLVSIATDEAADAIAISSYNGVAFTYVNQVMDLLGQRSGSGMNVYVGGKLNQVATDGSDLPRDIQPELEQIGSIPCGGITTMLDDLTNIKRHR